MSHTKEPWRIGRFAGPASYEVVREIVGATDIVVDTETGVYVLAQCNNNFPEDAKANARRIVACVNACAGLPTDTLETIPSWSSAGVKTLADVVKQRDELLAAMRRAVVAGAHHSIEAKKDCYNIIDATIRECVKSMEEV